MTALELVALAATTVWLGVLTLVAVLMVRQIGLISVRLDRDQDRSAPVGDGLPVGTPLPDPAAERAVRALRIATTPFVVEVRAGVIAVKAALRGADHLERFVEEAESVSTDSLGPEVQTYGG